MMVRHAAWALLVVACNSAKPPDAPPASAYEVHADPRVELLSIVERLAGAPEYQTAPSTAYVADVKRHFDAFASHPVVAHAIALRQEHGIGYDAPMTLALSLDDAYRVRVAPPDPRLSGVDLAGFCDELRDFAKQTEFDSFITAHRSYFAKVEDRLRTAIEKENPAPWFTAFFGQRAAAHFTVVPGMLTGDWNYGPHIGDDVYQVIGVARPDFDELPIVDASTLELVAHEMAHSYVNPIVAAHRADLEPNASRLFALVDDPMRKQAYTTWEIFLDEQLVRAVVVQYTRERHGAAAGDAAIAREEARSFRWTRPLADLLAAKHGDFAAAVPTLAQFLATAN